MDTTDNDFKIAGHPWSMRLTVRTIALVFIVAAAVISVLAVYGIREPQMAKSVSSGLLLTAALMWFFS